MTGVVVNHPKPTLEPVVSGEEEVNNWGGDELYSQENPGLAVATDILRVTELIDKDPEGFLL